MKPFVEQARSYAMYHQKPVTRYTHMVGIPLVILSFMILLGFVRVVIVGVLDINIAHIATLILLAYYFRLQWRLALAITPVLIFLLWIAEFFSYEGPTAFALWSCLFFFVLGSSLQLVGHFIEENRPAFIEHAHHIFIAPLVIMAEAFFAFGLMPQLKSELFNDKNAMDREVNTATP